MRSGKKYLSVEFFLLFIAVPVAYYFRLVPIPMIPFLILMFLLCWWIFARSKNSVRPDLKPQFSYSKECARILLIFIFSAAVISIWVYMAHQELLFRFVRSRPRLWLLVMILYPLLSVYPQEFIYRKFFFPRYREIFGGEYAVIVASAMAFSIMHVVFGNWIAIVLTFAGGILFAWTYSRTNSLPLVIFEHSLYGDFIFTIGLGIYFYGASYH